MSFIVKNTTKNNILDLFCPYRCRKCGSLGSLLCGCCKKDIIKQVKNDCQLINKLPKDQQKDFKTWFKNGWTCGWRDQIIGQLTQDYKFHSQRAAAPILAEILAQILPSSLPQDLIIVPLPTSSKHIRQRGFDHTKQIAKYLAKYRGWQSQIILCRNHNKTQVGSSLEQRYRQAEEAYMIKSKIDPHQKYLLLDDIWTTGASLCAAGKLFKDNGVSKIYTATIAISR